MSSDVAIVTGAGRGIGAACARLFAEQGYDVLLVSRSAKELEKSCVEIQDHAPKQKILSFVGDISDEETVERLFSFCVARLGKPTVLINNAAIIHVSNFIDMSIEDWDLVQNINVRGTMLCSKQAFIHMQEAGGSIVNMSSLAGVTNVEKFPGFVAYCASKAAIIGLTQALAVEGKEYQIRVNCLAPGAVKTAMLTKGAPFLETKVMPEDIAHSVFFLANPKSSNHITGTVLEVFCNE